MSAKILFVVSILLSGALKAQTSMYDLDKNLKKAYKTSDFPGFAIGIVKNDSVLFSKSYGFANVRDQIPFTERSIMPIASVSKTVIAFSLAKAIELGYFSPETPINEILPFNVVNPHYPDDVIRVNSR